MLTEGKAAIQVFEFVKHLNGSFSPEEFGITHVIMRHDIGGKWQQPCLVQTIPGPIRFLE